MNDGKIQSRFALYFGNRGFFPEALIAEARAELTSVLERLGHQAVSMDAGATRYGAVETRADGLVFARWLGAQRGKIDGVILCLPNFGDENGAVEALRDAGVPILIQAYPDELDKMDFAHRRDAFCGKFSIMDLLAQNRIPFTAFPPHVVHPASPAFASQVDAFSRCCRVVKRMRRLRIGAIGARTTAFKSVRCDELTLQSRGIDTETLDLSELVSRFGALTEKDPRFAARRAHLLSLSNWSRVPSDAVDRLARLGLALDDVIEEYALDALSLRCWLELEQQLHVAPCILLGDLNDRGVPAACELDLGNTVAMQMLQAAAARPATCLDWNNNYGDDPERCILFHCGPVPPSLMDGPGEIVDHPMFAKALGAGCGWGPNTGRIKATPMSFASTRTDGGRLEFYLGEGEFTEDPIPKGFFGCAGVARIPGLPAALGAIGHGGYRHHVSVTPGHIAMAVREACVKYLGYSETPLAAR